MKKVSMIFAVIFLWAGLASNAFADPDRSYSRENDLRFRHEQPREAYDYRHNRDFRDDRRFEHRPLVVHRVPAAPPRPVVHVHEVPAPRVSLYFPNFSIQFN